MSAIFLVKSSELFLALLHLTQQRFASQIKLFSNVFDWAAAP